MSQQNQPTSHAYDPIALSDESTVVAEYVPDPVVAVGYQSEAELEKEFIRILESQAYEYLPVTTEKQLIDNLRTQLENLNNITFTDAEWNRFFSNSIAKKNEGIREKTVRIQKDHVQVLTRDDGTSKNITLIDKSNVHNNRLQVINQYTVDRAKPIDTAETTGGARANRYDVTILVNGLPLVHVELKRRGVDIREAFNQINRYSRESFWAGSGLYDYVQLFVISNGTLTKYYSNTTRSQHIEENKNQQRTAHRKTSNSYEFTSWWADAQNKPIQELTAFAKTFFAKHALLNILTRYCVLTDEGMLLVMRPYQIAATERITQKITISTNYKKLGTLEAGGYVWHTTGSGKTLTSFKTAQLASTMSGVDKVLFVVDRKDLDYQTMREYDRFQKGAANSNTSTAVLTRQLEDPSTSIIITTIQKLSNFIAQHRAHPVYDRHVVLIFDECHRSQFGDMHTAITKAFKNYNLFGFTGTPIFAQNSSSGGNPRLKTTEQAFGEKLHTYTIVDAIQDKNVLPFRIDYMETIGSLAVDNKKVSAIDTERALRDPRRIQKIVEYTLEHYNQKTKREESYTHSVVANVPESTRTRRQQKTQKQNQRVRGFNALFATASIDAARLYYEEFKTQQRNLTPDSRLKIGIIYSYGANEAADDSTLGDDENFNAEALPADARNFLEAAIKDYNTMFGTSYDTSADKFQNYYKDLSQRLKNKELDLVIVVNMFLTGFDATTLNTLFVDKNLRAHGLIQAYSRTNRILNSVKTYGNIVTFRDLAQATNEALELFGNKETHSTVIFKPYREYYEEYSQKIGELLEKFPLAEQIVGEQAQKEFITLYGSILKLENILTGYDDFADQQQLNDRQAQDYRSKYLDLHAEYRTEAAAEKEIINDDLVFEIELIKQVEVNVDYILMLIAGHRKEGSNSENTEVRTKIARAVNASPTLRSKKDLIDDFIGTVLPNRDVDEQWQEFITARRESELEKIITSENLKPDEARGFMKKVFRDGELRTNGTEITKILNAGSRFAPNNAYGEKKRRAVQMLRGFYERFAGLISDSRD